MTLVLAIAMLLSGCGATALAAYAELPDWVCSVVGLVVAILVLIAGEATR